MFTIREFEGMAGLSTLALEGPDVAAELVPSRGGLLTRLRFGTDDVLFLDEATLADPTKNVRGGIPVLFPISGKLPGEKWTHEGHEFSLKQHGFARNRPFRVMSQETTENFARVTIALSDDEVTRTGFPFAFELRLTFTLYAAELTIETVVENRDTRPLPHQLGFHPYFRVLSAQKGAAKVDTDATLAFDNVRGFEKTFETPDFTVPELDWHLRDHTLPGTRLIRTPLHPLRIEWDEAFNTMVLWTLKDRDFVCVEPWTGPAGALATGQGVRVVLPGATDTLTFSIRM